MLGVRLTSLASRGPCHCLFPELQEVPKQVQSVEGHSKGPREVRCSAGSGCAELSPAPPVQRKAQRWEEGRVREREEAGKRGKLKSSRDPGGPTPYPVLGIGRGEGQQQGSLGQLLGLR